MLLDNSVDRIEFTHTVDGDDHRYRRCAFILHTLMQAPDVDLYVESVL